MALFPPLLLMCFSVFVCVNNKSLHAVMTQWHDRFLAEMKNELYLQPSPKRFWWGYVSTNPFLQSLSVPPCKTNLIMLCAGRTRVSAAANFWCNELHACIDSISTHRSLKFLEQEACSIYLLHCSVYMKNYLGIWHRKAQCSSGSPWLQ